MKRGALEFLVLSGLYFCSALLSAFFAFLILQQGHKLTPQFIGENALLSIVLPILAAVAVSILFIFGNGWYRIAKIPFWQSIFRSLKSTVFFACIWAVFLIMAKNNITESRHFFLLTILFYFGILLVDFLLIQKLIIQNYFKLSSAVHVGVVSTADKAGKITRKLKEDWSRKLSAVMLMDQETRSSGGLTEVDHIPVTGGRRDYLDWIRENALDEIIIVLDSKRTEEQMDDFRELVLMGIDVKIALPSLAQITSRITDYPDHEYHPAVNRSVVCEDGEVPMLELAPPQIRVRYVILKRLMDIVGGLVGSAVACVLYVLLGALIRLESPGPVIFAQERIGKNGRRFKMYKFRSMYKDAEARKAELMKQNEVSGLMFKMTNDPRITRVGKFIRKTSLDEFPQFWNVLKGDMSLVGTRPPTVGEFEQYNSYYKRRLSMKPGITGLWQVSGRSEIKDFDQVVKLDCAYIDNWSMGRDIQILLKTVGLIFTHKGAE